MSIREKITEVIEKELHPIPDEKRDLTHRFYYRDYKDNLIMPMDEKHLWEYEIADGGEMKPKGTRPAKMASLASSSAMTFNILGNRTAVMKDGQPFAPGNYEIVYEKQMATLNKSRNPANLDAFLSNKEAGEAIFCEMKMLEWLGKPNALKDAYCNCNSYFDSDAYDSVFSGIIAALRASDIPNDKNAYPSTFEQYDAWQMFKHMLSIYNASSEAVRKKGIPKTGSIAGEYKKITLVNVVFEMDPALIADEKLRGSYLEALELEHREAERFIKTMLSDENGLVALFKQECGVDFDIRYMPVAEFVSMFEKTSIELDALRRYCGK